MIRGTLDIGCVEVLAYPDSRTLRVLARPHSAMNVIVIGGCSQQHTCTSRQATEAPDAMTGPKARRCRIRCRQKLWRVFIEAGTTAEAVLT